MIVCTPNFLTDMEKIGCSPSGIFRVHMFLFSRKPRRFKHCVFWPRDVKHGNMNLGHRCSVRLRVVFEPWPCGVCASKCSWWLGLVSFPRGVEAKVHLGWNLFPLFLFLRPASLVLTLMAEDKRVKKMLVIMLSNFHNQCVFSYYYDINAKTCSGFVCSQWLHPIIWWREEES